MEIILKILILVKRFVPRNKKECYLSIKDVIQLGFTNSKIYNMLKEFYKSILLYKYTFTKQFKITNYILTFDKLISNSIPAKTLNLVDLNEELTNDSVFISLDRSNCNFNICCYWYSNKIELEFTTTNIHEFTPWKTRKIFGVEFGYTKKDCSVSSIDNDEFKKILLQNG